MFTVATWNVLHRVHAENWSEPVIDGWPDEDERIAAVTTAVRGLPAQVVALQEVSGDQLASLRESVVERAVHAFRYPQLPRPRGRESTLRDRGEYLVLIAEEGSKTVTASAFDSDPGKGVLVVETAGVTAISTHVSGDRRRGGQLRELRRLVDTVARSGPVALMGDFNSRYDAVATHLGRACTVAAPPADGPPSRLRQDGGIADGHTIDHVVVRGLEVTRSWVEPVGALSDHLPVLAALRVAGA